MSVIGSRRMHPGGIDLALAKGACATSRGVSRATRKKPLARSIVLSER